MLYSTAAGFACYFIIVFTVGVLVNTAAIEGSLIAFGVICFLCAYLVRYSKLVFRLAMGLGSVVSALLVAQWFLLPILAETGNVWPSIIALFVGLAVYLWSRRPVHRRYLRRDPKTGKRPAPPFGREWCRWVFAFVM